MADSVSQFSVLVREALPFAVQNMVTRTDDVMWQLADSFRPVNRFGRDTSAEPGQGASEWWAEWKIKVQEGGTLEGGTFGDTTLIQSGAYDELPMGQAANTTYPDPALAAMDAWIYCRTMLRRFKGVIPRNKDQIIAELLTMPMDKVVMDAVTAAVELYRHNFCVQAWSDGSAHVARVDQAAGASVTASTIAWVPVKWGTPFRFKKGQKYVAGSYITAANYGSSTRTARKGNGAGATDPASIMYCVGIDKLNRKVGLLAKDGEGTISLTDGDVLMPYNMFDFDQTYAVKYDGTAHGSRVMNGVENLVIATGTFPGARAGASDVTVDNVTELMGFVTGDEDDRDQPAPELIAELIDLMTDGGKKPPPVLIAEQSLWTLYAQIERAATAIQIVPQGGPFRAAGGVQGPEISHGAHTFTRLSSALCREGTVHGFAPGTMAKCIPGSDNAIKWFYSTGGVSGAPGIFGPVTEGRSVTSLMQAPYDAYGQIACLDPGSNMRRIGFESQRSQNA